MDLYCPICGEPWALDALHDVPDTDFDTARRRFRIEGCALFGSRHNRPIDGDTAAKSALLHDLLGDDLDGIASLMEE